MDVNITTIRRIAHLSRIALGEAEIFHMAEELRNMLRFVKILDEVDITAVEPMISIFQTTTLMRDDDVTDSNKVEDIIVNAPLVQENFFLVPKVIE